ncbi:MAG: hypothetical protein FWE80_07300 [Oscillospiraceae bacterium]|nr:hypothetical protein [Oscillospiraceae bacterium]
MSKIRGSKTCRIGGIVAMVAVLAGLFALPIHTGGNAISGPSGSSATAKETVSAAKTARTTEPPQDKVDGYAQYKTDAVEKSRIAEKRDSFNAEDVTGIYTEAVFEGNFTGGDDETLVIFRVTRQNIASYDPIFLLLTADGPRYHAPGRDIYYIKNLIYKTADLGGDGRSMLIMSSFDMLRDREQHIHIFLFDKDSVWECPLNSPQGFVTQFQAFSGDGGGYTVVNPATGYHNTFPLKFPQESDDKITIQTFRAVELTDIDGDGAEEMVMRHQFDLAQRPYIGSAYEILKFDPAAKAFRLISSIYIRGALNAFNRDRGWTTDLWPFGLEPEVMGYEQYKAGAIEKSGIAERYADFQEEQVLSLYTYREFKGSFTGKNNETLVVFLALDLREISFYPIFMLLSGDEVRYSVLGPDCTVFIDPKYHVADVDGDGHSELIVTSWDPASFSHYFFNIVKFNRDGVKEWVLTDGVYEAYGGTQFRGEMEDEGWYTIQNIGTGYEGRFNIGDQYNFHCEDGIYRLYDEHGKWMPENNDIYVMAVRAYDWRDIDGDGMPEIIFGYTIAYVPRVLYLGSGYEVLKYNPVSDKFEVIDAAFSISENQIADETVQAVKKIWPAEVKDWKSNDHAYW